jgi:hypothetical protein
LAEFFVRLAGLWCAAPNGHRMTIVLKDGAPRVADKRCDWQKIDTRNITLSADWIGRSVTGAEFPESTIRTPPRGRFALAPSQRSARILNCQWPD